MYNNLSYLLILLTLSSCAIVTSPSGGPKDVKNPKLVQRSVSNNATQFSGNKIVMSFDEYIQTQNVSSEVSVNPYLPSKDIEMEFRGKKVILTLSNLKPETTYNVSFGKSIVDVTERNAADSLDFSFSTGTQIDSNVSQAVANNPIIHPNFTLGLYACSDTISPVTHQAIYLFRASKGICNLYSVKPGCYQAFAFTDNNKNLKYDSLSEEIAIPLNYLQLPSPDSLKLSFFKEETRTFKLPRATVKTNYIELEPTKGLEFIQAPQYTYDGKILRLFDTQQNKTFPLLIKDSTGNKIDTVITIGTKYLKNIDTTFSINTAYTPNGIKPFSGLMIKSVYPLKINNLDSIHVQLNRDTISLDNKQLQYTFSKNQDTLFIQSKKATDTLQVIFKDKSFISPQGSFSTAFAHSYYGTENQQFAEFKANITSNKSNYIVYFIDANRNIIYKEKNAKSLNINYLDAGKYSIKVLFDTNNNGIYDTGDLQSKKQPEQWYHYPKSLDLKANWTQSVTNIEF